jgi:hypothetical protein
MPCHVSLMSPLPRSIVAISPMGWMVPTSLISMHDADQKRIFQTTTMREEKGNLRTAALRFDSTKWRRRGGISLR